MTVGRWPLAPWRRAAALLHPFGLPPLIIRLLLSLLLSPTPRRYTLARGL